MRHDLILFLALLASVNEASALGRDATQSYRPPGEASNGSSQTACMG
jgi:hypothetical protein